MLLSEIAERLELSRKGEDIDITGAASLASAGPSDITYLSDSKKTGLLETTEAGAVLVSPEMADAVPNALVTPHVKLAWAAVASLFDRGQGEQQGQSKEATICPSARVDRTAVLYPGCFIGPRAQIGPRVRVFPGCYVGEDCVVEEGSTLFPNVVLMARTMVGKNVTIHAGSVLGSDGYGYVPGPQGLVKIPQIGHVVVEDNVEIGANTVVDRAALDETRIGTGTKIDNLVQIAHNVRLGAHCLIISQVGIAGSTRVGNGVILAGQVGVADNLTIGDNVMLAAQSGVSRDIPSNAKMGGSPAVDAMTFYKISASLSKLPDMVRTMRKMEKTLDRLSKADSKE